MLKLSPYYLQKPFLLLHIQRIQCQPLHIRSGKHHLIIACIDIRTRRCTQHTPLSGSFGKSQMILLQSTPLESMNCIRTFIGFPVAFMYLKRRA